MKLTNFYEVMDRKGDIAWGGASASEATTWFRRGLDLYRSGMRKISRTHV
jgi:hypothetical protein